MNAQEVLNSLNSYNNVHNAKLTSIANQLKEITEQYNTGELSASEYKELLEDIDTVGLIVEGSADLNAQKQLNTIINVAITLASTAAKAI